MLRFRAEWQDAPGVKDKILARTWARLEIRAEGDISERFWPSNLISRAESVQRGIYGSVFPLAEWVIENWWSILCEPCRLPALPSGRMLAKDSSQRPWVQRHNLLSAREGGSLPDLFIFRDGPEVVTQWFADPEIEESTRPVQFFTDGKIRLTPQDAEATLQRLVEEVLARLDSETDDDASRLRENWRALCDLRQTESALCAAAAQMGLDPYDSSEVTDEFVATFEGNVKSLNDELRSDLLQASTPKLLGADVDWVNQALQKADLPTSYAVSSGLKNGSRSAHTLGYSLAEQFRAENEFPARPMDDLPESLHTRCGWPREPRIALEGPSGSQFAALVAKDRHGVPHVVGPTVNPDTDRFRLARAVYFLWRVGGRW